MKFGKKFFGYMAAGTLALAVADAQALSITVNATGPTPGSLQDTDWSTIPAPPAQLEIAKFNEAGATLTGVSLSFISIGDFSLDVGAQGDGGTRPVNVGTYTQNLDMTLTGLGLAAGLTNHQDFISTVFSGANVYSSGSTSNTVSMTIANSFWSQFVGGGNLLYDVEAFGSVLDEITSLHTIFAAQTFIKGQANMSISYDYTLDSTTPPDGNVPAPGALILIGTGLLVMGMWRRRMG